MMRLSEYPILAARLLLGVVFLIASTLGSMTRQTGAAENPGEPSDFTNKDCPATPLIFNIAVDRAGEAVKLFVTPRLQGGAVPRSSSRNV